MKDQEKNVLRMPEELIIDMNEHLPGNLTNEEYKGCAEVRLLRFGSFVMMH